LNSRKIVTALLTVLATGLALGFVCEDDATAAKRKPPLKIDASFAKSRTR
jgi:hypothetical protein